MSTSGTGKRYVVLAEGMSHDPVDAKTMDGVVRYSPHPTVAIVDSARDGAQHQGIPVVGTVDAATGYSPTTAIVGAAPVGGRLDDTWRALIVQCIEAGLDVESGLHTRLNADPDLRALAQTRGVRLTDLREPPPGISVPTGANLTVDATIVHTVGSDCAIGKKRMALELDLEARRRGLASVFVPTGQTGVAIAGWGVAVDAVVADFVAGAAEYLVVEGATRGDLLWVEGQGSIVHPWYSAVTLGLYHGSAPHLLVLCHKAGQTVIDDAPEHPIPPLPELIERYENAALPLRPARVAAIALNTAHLDDAAARTAVDDASALTGLPADDPVRFGAGRLVDAVLAAVPAERR